MRHIRSLIFVSALLIGTAHAETLLGMVIGVSDGDTITILDADRHQYKIRLTGIDAPEKAQAFGQKSKQSLAAMAFNKNVSVAWRKKDRYGRLVGKVTFDGIDINQEQVKAGMAWWYREYAKEQAPTDQTNYERYEHAAKMQRVGLWSDKNPMAPWDFRHGTVRTQANQSCLCGSGTVCTGPKGGRYCITSSGGKRYR